MRLGSESFKRDLAQVVNRCVSVLIQDGLAEFFRFSTDQIVVPEAALEKIL